MATHINEEHYVGNYTGQIQNAPEALLSSRLAFSHRALHGTRTEQRLSCFKHKIQHEYRADRWQQFSQLPKTVKNEHTLAKDPEGSILVSYLRACKL